MSKDAVKIMHQYLTSEHGFSVSWPRFITPVMAPRKDLDIINRKAIEIFTTELEVIRAQGVVKLGLWEWSR
jgi:hypothetical protein